MSLPGDILDFMCLNEESAKTVIVAVAIAIAAKDGPDEKQILRTIETIKTLALVYNRVIEDDEEENLQ